MNYMRGQNLLLGIRQCNLANITYSPMHEKGRCVTVKTLKITLPSNEPLGSITRRLTREENSNCFGFSDIRDHQKRQEKVL